jgi:hypothetical protein
VVETWLLRKFSTITFRIGGKEIEFVVNWPHLGHVLNKNTDDGMAIDKIQSALCSQRNNVLCYFGHLSPVLKLKFILFRFMGA